MRELVKVKVLDTNLQKTYGRFMHVGQDKAARGVTRGIWEIVPDEMDENAVYQTREMTAKSSREYLTREKFAPVRPSKRGISMLNPWGTGGRRGR